MFSRLWVAFVCMVWGVLYGGLLDAARQNGVIL